MAVASSPLSSEAITVIATISGAWKRELRKSAQANRKSVAPAPIAMMRTGRIREPIRSDQRPTAMRPSALINCATVTRTPAAATDQFRFLISHTSMNVTVTVCGTIIRPATAWIRHSTNDPRYGLASSCSLAASRGLRGGSTIATALATAPTAQATAGNISPARGPCSASSGITKAPNAIPRGCAVWRIPIANPRWCGGNQADTRRPPAVLQLAAAIPPRNKNTPVNTIEWAAAAA
ncbi:hypothetical protein AWB93_10305 [Mycobacterium bohemicum]|uniref:Uncharacterized protein n=1 Tax=Mycobacterium bohemicum TaxID=56425 RepID=A0A1X1R624_MYCBE|nr:hypothetical protein AWB93_10305 [Mycobacterium bohemicum]